MTNSSILLSPKNLVNLILDDIYLKNVSTDKVDAIQKIGAHEETSLDGEVTWKISYVDEYDLAAKLERLNELGFLFVGAGPGWYPAAVFEHMREKKLLTGKCKAVIWRGPSDWYIVKR